MQTRARRRDGGRARGREGGGEAGSRFTHTHECPRLGLHPSFLPPPSHPPQWDTLLIETSLLSLPLFLLPAPFNALTLWLLRLLSMRFVFVCGAVKLLSGDAKWWPRLTATAHHL